MTQRVVKFFLLLLISTYSLAQTIDDIPWGNKKYLKNSSLTLSSPSNTYSRGQAEIEHQILLLKYQRDVKIENKNVFRDKIKISTEFATEVINQLPYASIAVNPIKEWAYQNLEKFTDNGINQVKNDFNTSIINAFDASTKAATKSNASITFDQSLQYFKQKVSNFKNTLGNEDYQIIAPRVDEIILDFVQKNRAQLEAKFNEARTQTDQGISDLTSNVNQQFNNLKNGVTALEKITLLKIKENADALETFSSAVQKTFKKHEADIKEIQQEVRENTVKINQNEAQIKTLQGDVKAITKLTLENKALISENSYKIDVLADVLYDNVNTAGKIKLLDMQFKNDKTNVKYEKEKGRLDNIEAIENIQNNLAIGKEVVGLAVNLGLSPEDAGRASKALEIGNVIANGAMAYFTGNPLQGLQAINGAFAVFGGSSTQPNPEFQAIMQQFQEVNKRLDTINNKLDTINKNLIEFRNLTIDLHQENQRRFDQIEERLERLQFGIDNLTGLVYAQTTEGLMNENVSGYGYLWAGVSEAVSINELRQLYNDNQKIKNTVSIVYSNTENASLASKPFLHFNRFDINWENDIYKPVLDLTKLVLNGDLTKIEKSPIAIYSYQQLLQSNVVDTSFKHLMVAIGSDYDRLIYPQSILSITEFLILFEPYYYFSSSSSNDNRFAIPNEIILQNINYKNKNKNLKMQFMNLLKENRTAILQTNIISGVPILAYLRKHIEEPTFKLAEKSNVYKILLSDNYYLQTNLANTIIYSFIKNQSVYSNMLYELMNSSSVTELTWDRLLAKFNQTFENRYYKLEKLKEGTSLKVVLSLKPMNLQGIDASKQTIHLKLPSFETIFENRITYPSYLEFLYSNRDRLVNRALKYDMVEKMNESNFINLKLLTK